MKKAIQKWAKEWWIIDVIFLGTALIFILRDITKSYNIHSEIEGICLNLSIEIIGAWLSIRIIDRILEKRNKTNNVRLYTLENLKHFYEVTNRFITWDFFKKTDLDDMIKEKRYFKERWNKRRKYFYPSETSKIEEIEKLKEKIISEVESFFENVARTSDERKLDRTKLSNYLLDYDKLIEDLREDIWEESHPDE